MAHIVRRRAGRTALLLGLIGSLCGSAWAVRPKDQPSFLDGKAFFRPELVLSSAHLPFDAILLDLPPETVAAWNTFLESKEVLAVPGGVQAFFDSRSGAATNVIGTFPLLPGSGVGNSVTLKRLGRQLGRDVQGLDETVVADVARRFVEQHAGILGIDAGQLGETGVHAVTDELWQVSLPQAVDGVPVRHGRVIVTIKHGNVVLFGTESWGNARVDTRPRVSAEKALAAGLAHIEGETAADEILAGPTLEIVPVAPQRHQKGERFAGPVGAGYQHRLVWSFVLRRFPDDARWEFLVDARSGELLAMEDINHYVERSVTGGVYPLTSTGICPDAQRCGTMESGWPMPFADTGFSGLFTNSAGVYDYSSGTATTTLTGQYVDINDSCGSVNASSGTGDIALGGSNNQHDCTTPGSGGAGNTPASRAAFYEVNKLAEMARGWLPNNNWLESQLDTNVNINNTCNAFWNGSSINFYRSGGGCRNTGEIAAIFDHEWGHGLDDFDSGGSLSSSSEAYADIAAIYRLNASCVGYGFFETVDDGCGQTADGTGFNANEAQTGSPHCDTDCSGVRDADWAKHDPDTPDTALGFVCSSCLSGSGPCGRQVHCSAAPTRQAAWDLVKRDLTSAPFNYDTQTALLVGNKVFYQGSGNVGSWHACTCGSSSSGCGSTNGYMQWLAADDDNGSISDGTPHMTAIFDAFDRHGIACSSPTPANSGCSGQPNGTAGPTLSATAGSYSAALSWSSVSGASSYWVLRTEGHAGPEFGKAKIAEVTGTSYTDTEVANDRDYWYNVVAQGSSSACYSRVSNAVQVTPQASTEPDFSISCSPSSLTVTQGDATTSTCTVSSTNGFSSGVTLSCAAMPAGSSCAFSPNPVTPPADGQVDSTLTVSAAVDADTGAFSFDVQGDSGSLTRTFPVSLTVNPVGGGGDEFAEFDSALQAPKCGNVGRSCDTGATLIQSRDNISGGGESNQPNTINDSCADGTSGTYLTDESLERLKVVSVDGTEFAPGKQVRVEATVHVWPGGPTSDRLDLYYAADAADPSWQVIATDITPTSSQGGIQTFTATYTLPTGALQAVRAQFRYQGSPSTCTSGGYNDRDDLVFAVESSPGGGETAVFDAALQAPKCGDVGSSCDSGETLIRGRDNMSGGAESNQPNTINDSCADGTSGTYLTDESLERLKVVSVDGSSFAPGKEVRVEATVHVWSGGPTSDHLDLYYAADAASPSWQTIATDITPTSGQGGIQTFTATYTLPSGGLQAVRAQFRYQGSPSTCTSGSYNDRDDLAFAVSSSPIATVFADDFETSQGWTPDPNGTDTATTGQWERGDPEATSSSGPKQLGTTVSGVNDLVTGRLAGSSVGVHDIDGGVTSIRSPAISLPSSGTLTLSFSYYLSHLSNASNADFLRVHVVGATTSTVFEELGAANDDDAAWATHSADISGHAGQTVRLLIEAADASGGSLVEAAVDDVRITQQ